MFIPLTCEVSVSRMSGASASSGELEREMKDGSSRGPLVGVPGAAWEPCAMTTESCGLEGEGKYWCDIHKINSDDDSVYNLFPRPLGGLLGSGPLGRGGGGVAGASFGLLAVLKLTAGTSRAWTGLWEVWTQQSVFLLTLLVRDGVERCWIKRAVAYLLHPTIKNEINISLKYKRAVKLNQTDQIN